MTKAKRVLFTVFLLFFCTGILLASIGRAICVRNNRAYESLQPELFAPDEIATVLRDGGAQRLYVCYNDASYVNVYTEDGEFLWAVSTPYLRNAYFDLTEEHLIIYNHDDAYIYRSADGAFVEKRQTDEVDVSFDWEDTYADEFLAEEFYFDTYQVYRANANGDLTTVVARPGWYRIFHFGVGLSLSSLGALGLGILFLLSQRKEYIAARKETDVPRAHLALPDRKAVFVLRYSQVTAGIHILYAVLNILFGILMDGILCLGIFPVAIHFIIASIICQNRTERMHLSENERSILSYWETLSFGSFLVAFFSVLVAAALA